ncbi:MAG: 1-acyl-sn-glycerol-3-phosphate acyltransferase, partial [Mycobacterium sp.]
DSRAIRLSELQERLQKYGTDGVTRPGDNQSGLH